jgi:RNA polymerase sigma factor for flagellar operon FliA
MPGTHTVAPSSPAEQDAAAERERLILENLGQVKLIASRIHQKVPQSVSLDDLTSAGIVGLIMAIDNLLRQIAEVLKMHETRVSQLKSQAILRLRTYLRARWPTERGL